MSMDLMDFYNNLTRPQKKLFDTVDVIGGMIISSIFLSLFVLTIAILLATIVGLEAELKEFLNRDF